MNPGFDSLPAFECPRCQSTETLIWRFPHPLILHWVLNPGLVVNELLLGQRIPRITYACRQCGNSTTLLRYYQCPECGQFHPEAVWSGKNGFGHWLGLICPDCGGEIPCVINVTSWILLARLSPVNWVLRRLFAVRYAAWEQHRAWREREALMTAIGDELPFEDSDAIDDQTFDTEDTEDDLDET